MNKKVMLAGVLAFLCGCATTANYKKVVGSWVGTDAQTLVNSWGYPDSTFNAPNGNNVYEYSYNDTFQTSRYTTYSYDPLTGTGNANTYGGETLSFYCKTYFEVDKDKKVVRATFKGNSCKASASESGRKP